MSLVVEWLLTFSAHGSSDVEETPRSGKSNVWACFDSKVEMVKDDNTGVFVRKKTAQCKFCSVEISCPRGNTSNLWSHVEKKHKSEYVKHASEQIQKTRIGRSFKAPTVGKQPTITSALMAATPYSTQSREHKERIEAVLDYVVSDGRPLSTVERPKFVKMLKVFDNRFTLPSRRTITETNIPDMYMRLRCKIQQLVLDNKHDILPMFSFTTDLWSSATLEPYMSLTIHYLTPDMSLACHVLETKYFPERHTGINIATLLEELLQYWKLDLNQLSCITTDSARNMVSMAREAGIVRLPCFGHLLHNGVQQAMKHEDIQQLLTKLKRIVAYFHQSHPRTRSLKAEQKKSNKKEKTIHGPCPTRWGSTYEMVKDINDNLPEIKRVVVVDASELVPSPDEEKIIRRIVEAFAELNLMTDQLSSEQRVSVSSVLPMMRVIKNLTFQTLKDVEGLTYRNSVYNYIEDRLEQCSHLLPRLISLFLLTSTVAVIATIYAVILLIVTTNFQFGSSCSRIVIIWPLTLILAGQSELQQKFMINKTQQKG